MRWLILFLTVATLGLASVGTAFPVTTTGTMDVASPSAASTRIADPLADPGSAEPVSQFLRRFAEQLPGQMPGPIGLCPLKGQPCTHACAHAACKCVAGQCQ